MSPGSRFFRGAWPSIAIVVGLIVVIFAIFGVVGVGRSSNTRPSSTPAVFENGTNYPAAAEQSFLDGCNQTGPSDGGATCDCMLAYIEAHVAYKQFVIDSEAFDAYGTSPAWLDPAVAGCVGAGA